MTQTKCTHCDRAATLFLCARCQSELRDMLTGLAIGQELPNGQRGTGWIEQHSEICRQIYNGSCRVIYMNINGVQIRTYMVNMIADHMTALIKGGMEADVETLHHAVRLADRDVQSLGTQMLAGNAHHNASELRGAIAAEVYAGLTTKSAA